MLAIKLSRVGKKKQPSYRLLVLEKTKDPWGDYLENVGIYNPKTRPKVIQFNAERIKYWLSKGAQPTPTVHNLLISQGIIEGKKLSVTRISKRHAERLAATKTAEEKKTAERAAPTTPVEPTPEPVAEAAPSA
ncbi:30S ribosomal protein S16 [Candidatus Uhrbacteria bacterium]|nr:30S ribosomal protein S16 [Candidatus Uhrbacteria bacterium]